MIPEVTIDAEQLPTSAVVCADITIDGDDEHVPAIVPVSEDEDGSDSDEGYSSMSDDEDEGGDAEEDIPAFALPKVAQETQYHELYLPFDTTPYAQPIAFSGGMDAAECEEYYRSLEEAELAAAELDGEDGQGRKRSPLFRCVRRDSKKSKGSDDDSVSTASFHSVSSSASSISFSDTVTVYPVHAIDVFPDDVWDRSYTPRRQVKEQKKRAKLEFRFDGRDWRSATEEDGMFLDPQTGLLEHPVHYYNYEVENRGVARGLRDEVLRMCLGVPVRR